MTALGRKMSILNYGLATIAAAGTYAMMILEAWHANQWTHVLTLTPLMPYLLSAVLTYRHRSRPRFGAMITMLTFVAGAIGWPVFWFYYVPKSVRPATRVMTKIVFPILQSVVLAIAGAIMELVLAYRVERPQYETNSPIDIDDKSR